MIYGKRYCRACDVLRDLSDYPGTSQRCITCIREADHAQALKELRLPITPTQDRVAELMSMGLTNKQIGLELHKSPFTVKSYISDILQKLDAPNRTLAAVKYLRLKGEQ